MACRGLGKNIHDHKLHKFIIKENEESDDEQNKKTNTEKLQALIDEKANYNIDDVIDGELGTKFHYTKVPKEDSGLTDDMLLLLDDKVLNKYLPLKKITAYNDYKLPSYKKKAMLNRLEKLVNKKKKELAQDYEDKNQNEKENEKFLIGHKTKGEHEEEDKGKDNKNKDKKKDKNKDKYKNKDKHNKNDKKKGENNDGNHKQKLSRDEFKKQKRLETYGISE
jgi:protein KRI1